MNVMNVLKLTAVALGLAVAGCAATPTPSVSFVQEGDAATAVTPLIKRDPWLIKLLRL